MSKPKQYIILAEGDFPSTEKSLEMLNRADVLICCDGAVNCLCSTKKIVRHPDFIVGDMDSISPENLKKYGNIVISDFNQENNDLSKSFNFTLTLPKEGEEFEITILGATGKREDHTLGNISLLLQYGEQLKKSFGERGSVSILSDFGRFIPVFDSCSFSLEEGSSVSIFSDDKSLQISSFGLEYPTDNVVFDAWWKATLNRTCSNSFSLKFNHPSKVLLYFAYDF